MLVRNNRTDITYLGCTLETKIDKNLIFGNVISRHANFTKKI